TTHEQCRSMGKKPSRPLPKEHTMAGRPMACRAAFGSSSPRPPSPPTEQTDARQDQARQSSTDDGAGNRTAKVEPRVKVIGTFPADSHRAIIYPVAATVTAKLEADTYLSYLRSTAAIKAVFDKYGFIYLWRRVAC